MLVYIKNSFPVYMHQNFSFLMVLSFCGVGVMMVHGYRM